MTLLQDALDYAARGLPVLPVAVTHTGKIGHGAWRKAPLNTSPVAGQGGCRGASLDDGAVRAWWARSPDAQIGIAAGHPLAGGGYLFVVDDDGALAQAESQCGPLPASVRVETPSGGWHVYLRSREPLPNGKGALAGVLELDVRGLGGFVVAPPSVRPDGAAWRGRIDIERIAWIPEAWVTALAPQPSTRAPYVPPALLDTTDRERLFVSRGLQGACLDIVNAGDGLAHKVMHDKSVKMGGYIAAGLLDEDLAVAELQRAGAAAGRPPREVTRTVGDGIRAGKQRPIRPQLGDLGRTADLPSKAEALAWWDAHPEANSSEAAQVLGIKAVTLRAWLEERQAVSSPAECDASDTSPPGEDDVSPASSSDVELDDPVAHLAEIRQRVTSAETKALKAAPLFELLGDPAWLERMVAVRMAEPTAGVTELGLLGEAYHGARSIVNQVEEAIRVRRKAIVDAAKEALRSQPPRSPPPGDDGDPPDGGGEDSRPEIIITTNMAHVLDEAVRTLDHEGELYQRGGLLVHLTRDRSPRGIAWDPDAPSLKTVRHARLRVAMSSAARWMKGTQGPSGWEYSAALPPTWAVEAVLAQDEWPFRRAQGISEIPILRPDGTLHAVPGYDEVSGYIHEPLPGFRLPALEEPLSQDLAARAYQRLCDPFIDFPFADPWHKAAAVACLLSLIARPAIDGPVPLFPFLSTTPKSGKSLMVEIIYLIATGREIARMVPGETEEEIEKRITMIAMAAYPAVLFDNLTGTFGGPSLDAAVQARVWQGRLLGKSEPISVPIRTVWTVTGNNLAIKGDLAQRVLPIQLAPDVERPELRTDFVIKNLRAYVREHRAALLAAAFALLRSHAEAGRPTTGTFGGYDEWNTLIRGALVWAGAPDPYQGVAQLVEVADERQGQVRALLETWFETFATQDVYLADLQAHYVADRYGSFFAVIKSMATSKDGHPDLARLPYILRLAAGRIYGGHRLDRSESKRHGARAWKVTRLDVGGASSPASYPVIGTQVEIPY